MRLWLLAHSEPTVFTLDPISYYTASIAAALEQAGHEVTVIAFTSAACDRKLSRGVRLIGLEPEYDHPRRHHHLGQPDERSPEVYRLLSRQPALSFQMADEVIRLLDSEPLPDLIESPEYLGLPYYLIQRKLTERGPLERIPIIVHLHSPQFEIARVNQEPEYRFPAYWTGQMEKFCLAAADGLLAPSQFAAQMAWSVIPACGDVNVIPYPLDLSWSAAVVEMGMLPGTGEALFFDQTLEPRSGVLPLLNAFESRWQAGDQTRLSVWGDDADFAPRGTKMSEVIGKKYQRWIEAGLLSLTIAPDFKALRSKLNAVDYVVAPSLWNAFSCPVMLAAAHTSPLLVSQAGWQAEFAASLPGCLSFDWNTADDFERQLARLDSLTPQARQTLRAEARRSIRQLCDPGSVSAAHIDYYKAIINQQRTRRTFPKTFELPASPAEVEPLPASVPGLLSIVIPFHNLGKYLPDTVASALATTYHPLEVLVVDDGSLTAYSLDVLRMLEARQIENLRIIHTPNQGLAHTRNFGAEQARGEYLLFLDADDQLTPDFCAKAIDVLRRYDNVAFVSSWIRAFDGGSGVWPMWNPEPPYLLGNNMLSPMAVMRRDVFLCWGRNKADMAYSLEDYESWVSIVEAGWLGVSLQSALVRYRIRRDSMYHGAPPSQLWLMHQRLSQHHASLYRQWGLELFNLLNANGAGWLWGRPVQDLPSNPYARIAELEEKCGQLEREVASLQDELGRQAKPPSPTPDEK